MKIAKLFVQLGAALLCATLSASESYMVVRLVDPVRRDVIAKAGIPELKHPDLRDDEVLVFVTDKQLADLQNEPIVAFVYPASLELIQGIPVHSCTQPESDLMAQYVMNVGKGWGAGPNQLTYSIQTFTAKLGREQTIAIVDRALSEWAKHVKIEFTLTETASASRNLNVVFASGAHGDAYPFDGPRKALAHTFFPADVNPEPIAGDLHFDEDENWAAGVDPDFYSVALHEIGHALGLGHSDRPNAVMYPYYRRFETLLADDIAAIRRLYPARQESQSGGTGESSGTPPAPSRSPVTEANPADTAAPALRILYPAMTISSTSAANTRISGIASDPGGVALVSWTASGGRSGVANGTTSWTIPDFVLRLGDNLIIVRAYDIAGNMSWRSVSITRR